MKYLIIFILISCSLNNEQGSNFNKGSISTSDREENRNLIGIDMMNFDSRVRAKLIREEKISDFSSFSANQYIKKLHQYKIPSEQEYVDFISSKDIEIEISGKNKVFALCTRSKAAKLVFCDRADTARLEFSDTHMDLNLKEKVQELLRGL